MKKVSSKKYLVFSEDLPHFLKELLKSGTKLEFITEGWNSRFAQTKKPKGNLVKNKNKNK